MITVRKTFVDYKPPISEDYIWIDVSGAEPVQKIFLNGEWRPLKDADVDAEFESGQKVSDIALDTSSGTSSNNSKIPTVAKLNETLSGYHERAAYTNVEVVSTTVDEVTTKTATITYNKISNNNYVVNLDGAVDKDPDIVRLIVDSDHSASNSLDSVTTIRFKSTSTPTSLVYDEQNLLWANDAMPEIESGFEYIIAIWNKIAVITKIKTIPISNS